MMIEIFVSIGYLILGLIVGFLAGAFGIGGGVIMVPSFMYLFKFHHFPEELIPKFAIGTSLFASFLASSSGAYAHIKNKNINIKLGIILGSFAVLSGFSLSFLAVRLSSYTLRVIFAFVLLLVSFRLIFDNNVSDDGKDEPNKLSLYLSPIIGVLIGSLSAFAGVGGGIIAVPILHYIFKLRFKTSIGTSSLIIIFSAFSAAVSYIINGLTINNFSNNFTLGYVYLLAAIPSGIGTLISGRLGANFAHRTVSKKLKILFAVLILLIDLKILYDIFVQG